MTSIKMHYQHVLFFRKFSYWSLLSLQFFFFTWPTLCNENIMVFLWNINIYQCGVTFTMYSFFELIHIVFYLKISSKSSSCIPSSFLLSLHPLKLNIVIDTSWFFIKFVHCPLIEMPFNTFLKRHGYPYSCDFKELVNYWTLILEILNTHTRNRIKFLKHCHNGVIYFE